MFPIFSRFQCRSRFSSHAADRQQSVSLGRSAISALLQAAERQFSNLDKTPASQEASHVCMDAQQAFRNGELRRAGAEPDGVAFDHDRICASHCFGRIEC
jgi:Tfp pilus assembly protein PilX